MGSMTPQIFFRIIYRFLYLLLILLLLALLLATPADIIRQALLSSQSYLILVIAVCYFLTIVVVAFIYATRLYINRSVLASIPKSWIPIERGDVSEDVRQMIVESLSRSAAVAFHARPRTGLAFGDRGSQELGDRKEKVVVRLAKDGSSKEQSDSKNGLPPLKPVWGDIEHYGWASPESPDLPNLQYSTVVSELPNLIEAKALTLAPPDDTASQTGPPTLVPEAVALLQRAEDMDVRKYLAHLAELQVLVPAPATADFLQLYEHALFSTRPTSNARFRELMHLFAEILRTMQPLAPDILQELLLGSDGFDDAAAQHPDTDIDEDAPLGTIPITPRSQPSQASLRSHASNASGTPGSVRRLRPGPPGRNSSADTGTGTGTWQYRTAPTTPKSRRTALSRSSSVNNFAQSRRPYAVSSQASSTSLRSAGTQGSVIIRPVDHGEVVGLQFSLEPGNG